MNFYADLSMLTPAEREAATMEFTVGGKKTTDTFDPDCTNPSTHTLYGFTCYINSVQMADEITAVLKYTQNGQAGEITQTYSAETYIDHVLSHTGSYSGNAVALVRAIADYGHYVQPFLAGWTVGTEHAAMPVRSVYTDTDVSAAKTAVEGYAISRDASGSRIAAVTYSLNLETETAIRIYLRVQEGYTGPVTAAIGNNSIDCVLQSDGRYRIEIGGISAHKLGDTYEITVSAGGEFTISVSALSYVNTVLNSTSSVFDNDTAHWAVTSLYQYYDAAIKYKEHPNA